MPTCISTDTSPDEQNLEWSEKNSASIAKTLLDVPQRKCQKQVGEDKGKRYSQNDVVWSASRAVNGVRDAVRTQSKHREREKRGNW